MKMITRTNAEPMSRSKMDLAGGSAWKSTWIDRTMSEISTPYESSKSYYSHRWISYTSCKSVYNDMPFSK
jgi:hypothetical protein